MCLHVCGKQRLVSNIFSILYLAVAGFSNIRILKFISVCARVHAGTCLHIHTHVCACASVHTCMPCYLCTQKTMFRSWFSPSDMDLEWKSGFQPCWWQVPSSAESPHFSVATICCLRQGLSLNLELTSQWPTIFCLRQCLSLNLDLANLFRLGSESPSNLCPPGLGITCHSAACDFYLHGCWAPELKSSCLHTKPFSYWTIPQTPSFFLLCSHLMGHRVTALGSWKLIPRSQMTRGEKLRMISK